jgi:arsenate reductase-like glutaredoxin family protein
MLLFPAEVLQAALLSNFQLSTCRRVCAWLRRADIQYQDHLFVEMSTDHLQAAS